MWAYALHSAHSMHVSMRPMLPSHATHVRGLNENPRLKLKPCRHAPSPSPSPSLPVPPPALGVASRCVLAMGVKASAHETWAWRWQPLQTRRRWVGRSGMAHRAHGTAVGAVTAMRVKEWELLSQPWGVPGTGSTPAPTRDPGAEAPSGGTVSGAGRCIVNQARSPSSPPSLLVPSTSPRWLLLRATGVWPPSPSDSSSENTDPASMSSCCSVTWCSGGEASGLCKASPAPTPAPAPAPTSSPALLRPLSLL